MTRNTTARAVGRTVARVSAYVLVVTLWALGCTLLWLAMGLPWWAYGAILVGGPIAFAPVFGPADR